MIEEHASYESSDGEGRDERADPKDDENRNIEIFDADPDATAKDLDKTVEEDDSRNAAEQRKSVSQMRPSALESCDFLDLNS